MACAFSGYSSNAVLWQIKVDANYAGIIKDSLSPVLVNLAVLSALEEQSEAAIVQRNFDHCV